MCAALAMTLGFVTVAVKRIALTPRGEFAGADIQASKDMFHQAALEHVPLVRLIRVALERSEDGGLREGFFTDLLRRHYSAGEARAQLDTVIDWARYAELYEYDAGRGELTLAGGPSEASLRA